MCGETFVLDRQVQPWARARTCSESCAKRLANRDRRPVSCRHCEMVDEYQVERERQETALEDGERDERAAERVIVFRDWLRHYPWPSAEVVELWSAA